MAVPSLSGPRSAVVAYADVVFDVSESRIAQGFGPGETDGDELAVPAIDDRRLLLVAKLMKWHTSRNTFDAVGVVAVDQCVAPKRD